MRKKQLFVLLLTGALVMGMAPSAAFAADEAAVLSIEGDASAGDGFADGGETGTDTPSETPAEPTVAPEEPTVAPEEPTVAPAEPTVAPEETPTQAPEETVTEDPTTLAGDPEPTQALLAAGGGSITYDPGDGSAGTSYTTLQEAISAIAAAGAGTSVDAPAKIIVSGDVEISDTVEIPSGVHIAIAAAAGTSTTTISRADGFTGQMFDVSGSLQFTVASNDTGDTGSLTVNGVLGEGGTITDSTVHVETDGIFTVNGGVTLTGGLSDQGGAIYNEAGGMVILLGESGTVSVSGNQAEDGAAIYSEGIVSMKGSVSISGNTTDGVTEGGILLSGSDAGIIVNGTIDNNGTEIPVEVDSAAAGTKVIALADGVTETTLKDAVALFTYAGDGFTLGEDGLLVSTTPVATTTPTPTATPTTTAPTLTGIGYNWTSHTTATITCRSDSDGWYYYEWVTRGSSQPTIDLTGTGTEIKKNTNFNIYLTDLDSENPIDVYVRVKDKNGNPSKVLLFRLSEESRPASATATPTPSRDPIVPAVTESVVQGLENPLEFYPNTFYEFTVIGAGTTNDDPVAGDVKWVPLYWSTSSNPADKDKHTKWQIGSESGISTAATYNLYVFFQRWEYNGTEWIATDTIESAVYQFQSAEITISTTVTPSTTVAGQLGTDGTTYADATATAAAQASDSTSKSAVSTADESPIGSMLMLAAASILAGGYVLIRRRKKISE